MSPPDPFREDVNRTPHRRVAVLPEHLAGKIAAGEVIQRPESVVKELLENSLDAHATSIAVVIKDGGRTLIQVTDDGIGMDEQDAVASFLRHATSKIATYEDLEAITTYGFRGEALASVAAVSHVTMKTRRREDDAAVVVRIDGGGDPRVTREGREPGTTLLVQNLFYNVPARRKFLKSDSTEFRHVYDAVHRVAISHPEISLLFVSDDETIFNLRPATEAERLTDVFGERQVNAVIPVVERGDLLEIRGYLGKPSFGQKNRFNQYLFLNRRFIVSRTVSHAIFTAYEHLLVKGTFPFFLLFLDIDPRRVDVNVHPSKLEAKFEDEQAIHRLIASVVRKALAGVDNVPSLTAGGERQEVGLRFTGRQHDWPGDQASSSVWRVPERVDPATGEIIGAGPIGGAEMAQQLLGPGAGGRAGGPSPSPVPDASALGHVWQLQNKYILCQIESGVMIVDQHVAHERVLYERVQERLKGELRSSQQLLFPRTIQLNPADASLIVELLPHLEQLGFNLKLFGKNTVVVEGIPPEVRHGDEERILEDILGLYREYQQESPIDVRENLAKSYSCRSAVKAGDPLSGQEMRSLLIQLFAARMPYVCPHGRPIVLRISTEELDRRFGRT